MLAFENELTKQIEKVTVENGFDAKALLFHLTYLETVLTKYPQSDENENIRL
jgi:hypothetical protein